MTDIYTIKMNKCHMIEEGGLGWNYYYYTTSCTYRQPQNVFSHQSWYTNCENTCLFAIFKIMSESFRQMLLINWYSFPLDALQIAIQSDNVPESGNMAVQTL